MNDSPQSDAPGTSGADPNLHKLPYAVKLQWKGANEGSWNTAVIDVESPVDQMRLGGKLPAPWADVPRLAWMVTATGQLHIAGWVCTEAVDPVEEELAKLRGSAADRIGRVPKRVPPTYSWDVIDLHIPWRSVLLLQVYRNDYWEGKEQS